MSPAASPGTEGGGAGGEEIFGSSRAKKTKKTQRNKQKQKEKHTTNDKEKQKHVTGRRRERRELLNTLPDPPCSVP